MFFAPKCFKDTLNSFLTAPTEVVLGRMLKLFHSISEIFEKTSSFFQKSVFLRIVSMET